jgi:hypothetical protein
MQHLASFILQGSMAPAQRMYRVPPAAYASTTAFCITIPAGQEAGWRGVQAQLPVCFSACRTQFNCNQHQRKNHMFVVHRAWLTHDKLTTVEAGTPSIVFDINSQQFMPVLTSGYAYRCRVAVPCPWGEMYWKGVRCTAVCWATLAPHMRPITNTQWNSASPHLDLTVCHPQTACRNIKHPTSPPI